jgi:hypothetical protein
MHSTPRKTLRAVVFMVLAASPAMAAPSSSFLPQATEARLRAGEDIRTSATGKYVEPSLAPMHPAAADIRRSLAQEAPDVIVEALFLWKKPSRVEQAAESLAIYNALRSIGSLQGIEYFSASRGRMRLFYEYSSLIQGPDKPTPVADTRVSSLPKGTETLFARQKDLSFGDNRYRITMWSGQDFVMQASTNLTSMSYKLIPVAGVGDLNVRVMVISTDDSLLFYAVSSAKATIIPGVHAKLEASFGNRAAAVYSWFTDRIAGTWPAR